VTAPAPVEQQPVDQQGHPVEDAILVALALYFASKLAIGATRLPARLVAQLVALGLSERAVRAAGRIALAPPLTGRRRHGSPTAGGARTTTVRTVASDEPEMRARYTLAAAKRLTQAITLGVYPQALQLERGYLDSHRRAGRRRAQAAAALDRTVAEHGPYLVWTTKNDARVDPACRRLAGTVFTIDNLPSVDGTPAIPGALHGGECRCEGKPLFDRSQPLPTIKAQPVGVS
jgi:hypothetical protein